MNYSQERKNTEMLDIVFQQDYNKEESELSTKVLELLFIEHAQ